MSTVTLVGIVAAIFLLPIIVASLTVCAPKWWREGPGRYVPSNPIQKVEPTTLHPLVRWLFVDVTPALQWSVIILLSPVLIIVTFAIYWWSSGWALILKKCPYTDDFDYLTSESYEMKKSIHTQVKEAWQKLFN